MIRANPADAQTRLVFADWLDDRSRARDAALQRVLADPASDAMRLAYAAACEAEGDHARAEFVRVQVAIANLPESAREWISVSRQNGWASLDAIAPQEKLLRAEFTRVARLQQRERDLWSHGAADWLMSLPGTTQFATHASSAFQNEATYGVIFGHGPELGRVEQLFRRGFMSGVACSASDWCQHGDGIHE